MEKVRLLFHTILEPNVSVQVSTEVNLERLVGLVDSLKNDIDDLPRFADRSGMLGSIRVDQRGLAVAWAIMIERKNEVVSLGERAAS